MAYLDHAASTPVRPEAIAAWHESPFGNPASVHGVGRAARRALEEAREAIAAHLGVDYVDGAWEWLPGMTRTWHPEHSDWTRVWTPQVQAVFDEIGGPALLERWGY